MEKMLAESKQKVEVAEAAMAAAEASRTQAVTSLEAEVCTLESLIGEARRDQESRPRDTPAGEKARLGTALAALQIKFFQSEMELAEAQEEVTQVKRTAEEPLTKEDLEARAGFFKQQREAGEEFLEALVGGHTQYKEVVEKVMQQHQNLAGITAEIERTKQKRDGMLREMIEEAE